SQDRRHRLNEPTFTPWIQAISIHSPLRIERESSKYPILPSYDTVKLGGWILAGNAYEMRTVVAMSLRTAFWLSLSAVSVVRSRTLAVQSTDQGNSPPGHSICDAETTAHQANDR
ncbi:MAG: hypothetical protein ACR65W_08730, partial [Methylocystis sp.]